MKLKMNWKAKKTLFIDLDGTLLDVNNNSLLSVGKSNLFALKKAREKGLTIVVSSGRFGKSSKPFLDVIKPDYAVLCNGAIIEKDNQILESKQVVSSDTAKIIEFCKANSLTIKFNDSKNCYGNIESKESEYVNKKLSYTKIGEYEDIPVSDNFKIVLWGKSVETMWPLCKQLNKDIETISAAISTEGYTIEITNKLATKGIGNMYVVEKLLKQTAEQAVHIGDSMNDFSVVDFMDLVAMENAPESLKSRAKYVGPHYKEGGFAKIIDLMVD